MYVVNVPSIQGYKPPKGYRIAKCVKLADGSYEVMLEPLLVA